MEIIRCELNRLWIIDHEYNAADFAYIFEDSLWRSLTPEKLFFNARSGFSLIHQSSTPERATSPYDGLVPSLVVDFDQRSLVSRMSRHCREYNLKGFVLVYEGSNSPIDWRHLPNKIADASGLVKNEAFLWKSSLIELSVINTFVAHEDARFGVKHLVSYKRHGDKAIRVELSNLKNIIIDGESQDDLLTDMDTIVKNTSL